MYVEFSALSRTIFPVKRQPHSTLHTPGKLPFWMLPDARSAGQGEDPICVEPGRPLRILQDTGHDLWLFLSRRGLEIRSLYMVPTCMTQSRMRPVSAFSAPFPGPYVLLKDDLIKWDDILPVASISSHLRLERAKLEASLPDLEEIQKRARANEQDGASFNPVSHLMLKPGSIEVDMHPVKFSIALSQDRVTDIKPQNWHRCAMTGFRQLGVANLSAQAKRLSDLASNMTLRQKMRMFFAKSITARTAPTPFPASSILPDTD